jgi:hypothetical protein
MNVQIMENYELLPQFVTQTLKPLRSQHHLMQFHEHFLSDT